MNGVLRDLADTDYVAVLEDDVRVDPGWIRPLIESMEKSPRIGATCPKTLFGRQYLDVTIRSPMFSLGGTDPRRLGVRVSGVEVGEVDRWPSALFVEGFLSPEEGEDAEAVFRWTDGSARLRVPHRPRGSDEESVRLRLAVPFTTDVTIGAGSNEIVVAVGPDPVWVDVPLEGIPRDVVSSAGGVVLADGSGAGRGQCRPDGDAWNEGSDVFAWTGGAVLFRRAYLCDVGLFDARLSERQDDTDLSWRGRARGWRYRYEPASVVRRSGPGGPTPPSESFSHDDERDRLVVLLKNAPLRLVLASVVRYASVTATYARRQVIYPVLLGRRPRVAVVRARAGAFVGFLRMAPTALRARARLRRRQRVSDGELLAWSRALR